MIIWKFIATFCFVGRIPIAPGTWSSLTSLILWSFIPISLLFQITIIFILFILGIISSKIVSEQIGAHDPSEIVIDEVLGMCISLFMLPHNIFIYALAFLLFRFFDILKPSFIYQIQTLPKGWGIMLDDIFAGLFTWLICIGITTIL